MQAVGTWLSLRAAAVPLSACALILFGVATQGHAQSSTIPEHALTAVHVLPAERLLLDGRLTEEAWRRAEPASGFRQQDPNTGDPATEETEVRVLYDDHRIVIGVTCFDSEPRRIMGNQMQRDQSLGADDRFMVAIDTYSDGRSGYYFEINPSGAMGDGLVLPGTGTGGTTTTGGGGVNRSWDGIWNARVERNEMGWTAEIEIPLHTINFKPDASSWGINFQRTIRRKTEETLWSGWARNQGLTYMPAAGRLAWARRLARGSASICCRTSSATRRPAPGRGSPSSVETGTVGGDVVYNVTPGLRANLSINTDFAETEVDQRQVNLTRFPLFFPEKRAFFLEGPASSPSLAETGNSIVPFFSRRIGLDDSGVPQPVDYGAKLTGHAGAFDVGALQVRTRDRGWCQARTSPSCDRRGDSGGSRTSVDSSRHAAMRLHRRDRRPVSTSRSRRRSFSTKRCSRSVASISTRPSSRGRAAAPPSAPASTCRTIPSTGTWPYGEVQDGYDPAVGFVDRRAYRMIEPDFRYTVHTESGRYRAISGASLRGEFQHFLQCRRAARNAAVRCAVDARRSPFERCARVPSSCRSTSSCRVISRFLPASSCRRAASTVSCGAITRRRRRRAAPCRSMRRMKMANSIQESTAADRHAEHPAASGMARECWRRLQRDLAARGTLHDARLAQ